MRMFAFDMPEVWLHVPGGYMGYTIQSHSRGPRGFQATHKHSVKVPVKVSKVLQQISVTFVWQHRSHTGKERFNDDRDKCILGHGI